MKFNDVLENLTNYEAGKPIELVVREFGVKEKDVLKLASNENPMGTSKKVQKALKKAAAHAHLYPDDSMFELKDALSSKYKIKPENIIIGSGSDQVIEFALHAKTNSKNAILVAGTTFAMYEIYAKHTGAKIYKTQSKQHDLDEFSKIYKEKKDEISVIFLCIPNNPLGECLDRKDVYKFIQSIDKDVLVIIDGAYNEFATFKDSKKEIKPKDLLDKFSNVLYLGTFSKIYGLGGMRIGYGIASEQIIKALSKLRAPFNVTTPSLVAALEVLKDEKFVEDTLKNNLKEMKKYEKFAKKNGLEFIPSYTNFITFLFKKQDSSEICDKLLRQGIILRNLKGYGMNAIRITIGLPKDNQRVLKALKELL
ncbi:histidinol-phosphate transaminase [Campylobacter geochelonis]|uniref:Histidinol-phosphate aminotransferase n=1 Tax=Campylobacter geochelonis TaxID=1780362 RepID=A0A128EC11_9BACT|nr:histidinol-phosphate transaminase [Campylobacter geochelonis]QKF70628.1 histidinol-phosphate aminotransferase [Campylobacter geochelonis]CZE45902.1 histidinol-phosphate aminotransferase [Campylobacter geochelonis]CZE46737.1 histidinol-phosphate aminotransferase [Campylobacter geochelonis]CZE50329.1 histidinol-phosphate aminotransferase [Campylobacter geochelonis]